MKSAAWFVLFFGVSLSPVRALDWPQKEISREVLTGTKEVSVFFAFANRTDLTVKILDVETSCGCTTARASTNTVTANSSGAVEATFTVGRRTGMQEKEIRVWTSESPEPVILRLRVKIGTTSSTKGDHAGD